ncbi:MAG: carboxylating nicotinate-nucleotide diphosphorylase [Opitutae bacterium]
MTPPPPRIEDFRRRISWREIEQAADLYTSLFECCVQEDLSIQKAGPVWQNDLTSSLCSFKKEGVAQLTARESFVLCGIKLPDLLFSFFSCDEVEFMAVLNDGDLCNSGDVIGILQGAVPQILAIERTLLNFIQRLSGVATKADEFVRVVEQEGVGLLDTRKTTPGLRIFEKFATACGGSFNHRMGLSDRILIKDNHLAAAGVKDNHGLSSFLKKIKHQAKERIVEVEIDDLSQLQAAIEAKVDAVLLDNFSPVEIAQAVKCNHNRLVIEASGGINQNNLIQYAQARPHFISTGAPVHQARWVDIGLDWNN